MDGWSCVEWSSYQIEWMDEWLMRGLSRREVYWSHGVFSWIIIKEPFVWNTPFLEPPACTTDASVINKKQAVNDDHIGKAYHPSSRESANGRTNLS